jgi:DNA polymerase-1
LARTLAVSTVQAEHLLQAYFKAFPKVKQYLDHVSQAALKKGEVRTLSGRRLVFTPELLQDQGHALRVAKNMPIQGTNADMIKTALAKMHQLLQSYEHAYIVHCVHDEIVVECHQSDAHSVQDMLEYAMKTAGEEYIQQVPVHVDSDITHIWD